MFLAFQLAEHLHLPLYVVLDMPYSELVMWPIYFEVKQARAQEEDKKKESAKDKKELQKLRGINKGI